MQCFFFLMKLETYEILQFSVTKYFYSPLHYSIILLMLHNTLSAKKNWSIFHQKGVRMSQQVIPPATQTLCSSSILIVEDDENVGEFLQQTIDEYTPYQTTVIHDGAGALERARQIQPCLLLLDYKLPGLNGLEIYDRLQSMEETRGVPTIMMSASLPVEELQRRGIYQLRKPMDIGNVIRMITHALVTFEERRLSENQPSI